MDIVLLPVSIMSPVYGSSVASTETKKQGLGKHQKGKVAQDIDACAVLANSIPNHSIGTIGVTSVYCRCFDPSVRRVTYADRARATRCLGMPSNFQELNVEYVRLCRWGRASVLPPR